MTFGCGCREISRTPIEFKIESCPQVHINCGPLLPNTNDKDFDTLQRKIVCDFKKVIKQLECGIQPDIEIILEEISLLFMNDCGYNVAKKMYSTDIEDDYFLRHDNFLSEFDTQEEKNQVLLNLGIYDKLQNMISKQEVNTIIDNTTTEINTEISNIVEEINKNLDTKIGFVVHIGKYYYGFATAVHYGQWLENQNDDLVIGKWIAENYVPTEFTIVFNTGEEADQLNPITVIEGFSFIFPKPTWNNDLTQHFAGWYLNSSFEGEYYNAGDRIVPTFGMVFYAKWVREQKILTFYYNYNDQTEIISSYLGETVNLYEELVRNGYIFNSWNTEQDGTGINYEAGDPYKIEDNQSFYAQWSPISYTISFNGNGSTSGEMQDQVLTYDEEVSLTTNVFARTGYTFAGWDVQPNGDNVTYTDGQSIMNLTNVNSTITLYARWTPIVYNITYVLNGGTISTNKETYTIEDTITLDNPTKTGYGFIGWYNNEDYTGSTIVNIPSGSYGDKTFYAKWQINTYTITFNDGINDVSNINVEYNTLLSSITYPSVSKEYYNLTGWNINQNGSGTNPTKVTSDITLYAQWTPIEYTIAYQLDGGTLSTTKNTYTVESNITLDNPIKTGYSFAGWYDNSNYTGSIITSITEGSHGNKTFYAKFEINSYNLTLVFNNDITPNQTISVVYNTLLSTILNNLNPEKENKLFTGWKTINETVIETMPANDITLYAQWIDAYRYKLATTIPQSEPEWSNSDRQTTTLGQLEGWNDWKGEDTYIDQYIILPYDQNKNTVLDYFDVEDVLTHESIISAFKIDQENSNNNMIIIYFEGPGYLPLNDSDKNAIITFK